MNTHSFDRLSPWESSRVAGERASPCEPSPSRQRRATSPGGGGYRGSFTRHAWKEFARTIKEAVTPQDVAVLYGITFDRGGFACCPFHGEKTPSFHITRDKTAFHCFGCGVSPDVIDMVMHMEGLEFPDALRKLNQAFSVGLPLDGEEITYRQQRELQRKQAERLRAEQAEKAARAEFDALWEAAISDLAACDCAIRAIRATKPPKGTPVDEQTAKALAALYGQRAYAAYRYENLPDETSFVERRRGGIAVRLPPP